jgi:carbon-monoxide dehydrogenase medium subunit
LLREHGDEAKVLAGGMSLVPLLNFRFARPAVLVDLSMLPEIATIDVTPDRVVVGAMARQRAVERSAEIAEVCPLLGDAVRHIGHVQIRERGTVGGSAAHADPAAEIPAVALALGAEFDVRNVERTRTIVADDFFDGPFTTALEPDELLTHVRFPRTDGARTAFLEVARRAGDFALAGVAAAVRFADRSSEVASARLAGLGLGGTVVRLRDAEAALTGSILSDETVDAAAAAAAGQVDPVSDVHASADYRRRLAGVLVRRAVSTVRA